MRHITMSLIDNQAKNMVRTEIYLPEDVYEILKYKAQVDQTSMAEIIRNALRKVIYIKKPKKSTLEMIAGIKSNADIPKDFSENYKKYLYGIKHE